MTFIDNVVEKIWEEKSEEYNRTYQIALQKSAGDLSAELKDLSMIFYKYPGRVNMNLLQTSGCAYRNRTGRLKGCSMCDYSSDYVNIEARLRALKDKDQELYAQVVRGSFENGRPAAEVGDVEVITGYNCLCPAEFPGNVLERVYGEKLVEGRPALYLEVRAPDVARESLERLKNTLGDKYSSVTLELGVEVGNEWLRNHWLNKGVKDIHIKRAIELAHEFGYKANADVLIGIPGLTEEQSVHEFARTISWLNGLGMDAFTALPLNRKKHTLQGFLYEHLRDDEDLTKVGIAQEEHTGLPWLITVVNALSLVNNNLGLDVMKKIHLAQLYPDTNAISNEVPYNVHPWHEDNDRTRRALSRLFMEDGIRKEEDFRSIFALLGQHYPSRDFITEDETRKRRDLDDIFTELRFPNNCAYVGLGERQFYAGCVKDTIRLVGGKVAEKVYGDDAWQYIQGLERELESLE